MSSKDPSMNLRVTSAFAAALAICTITLVNCSKSDSDESGSGDADPSWVSYDNPWDDAGSFDPDAAVSCTPLSNVAPMIPYQVTTGTAPVAQGGAVTAGMYALTSVVVYASGEEAGVSATQLGSLSSTLWVGDPTIQIISDGTVAGHSSSMGMFTVAGSALTMTDVCPDTRVQAMDYTATATTLTFIASWDPTETVVQTYTVWTPPDASADASDAAEPVDAADASDAATENDAALDAGDAALDAHADAEASDAGDAGAHDAGDASH